MTFCLYESLPFESLYSLAWIYVLRFSVSWLQQKQYITTFSWLSVSRFYFVILWLVILSQSQECRWKGEVGRDGRVRWGGRGGDWSRMSREPNKIPANNIPKSWKPKGPRVWMGGKKAGAVCHLNLIKYQPTTFLVPERSQSVDGGGGGWSRLSPEPNKILGS